MHDLLYTFTEMRFAVMHPKDVAMKRGSPLLPAALLPCPARQSCALFKIIQPDRPKSSAAKKKIRRLVKRTLFYQVLSNWDQICKADQ
jgi:hypothetical protein